MCSSHHIERFTRGLIMKYNAFSRDTAIRYASQKHADSSIIISIRSSFDKTLPNIECNNTNNVKDVLFLSFDDIDQYDAKLSTSKGLITHKQAKQIVDFCEKWYKDVDRIIVHCDGGVSRSVGIVGAISRWYEGIEDKVFDAKSRYPNMTCYLYVLDAFRQIDNIQISKF